MSISSNKNTTDIENAFNKIKQILKTSFINDENIDYYDLRDDIDSILLDTNCTSEIYEYFYKLIVKNKNKSLYNKFYGNFIGTMIVSHCPGNIKVLLIELVKKHQLKFFEDDPGLIDNLDLSDDIENFSTAVCSAFLDITLEEYGGNLFDYCYFLNMMVVCSNLTEDLAKKIIKNPAFDLASDEGITFNGENIKDFTISRLAEYGKFRLTSFI